MGSSDDNVLVKVVRSLRTCLTNWDVSHCYAYLAFRLKVRIYDLVVQIFWFVYVLSAVSASLDRLFFSLAENFLFITVVAHRFDAARVVF